jgi:C_GCAxxG_C_C family probable redox protein
VGEHVLGPLDAKSLRMATPFGGGVGGSREEACGAFTGGLMVIGGLHGRTKADEDDQLAYDLAVQYRQAFLDLLGTTQCDPIRKRYQKADGSGGCDQVVEWAARTLFDLLAE